MTEIEPKPASPWHNPSYPKRIHVRERAHWRGVLESWERRIDEARAEWEAAGRPPERSRLFAQMLGARDQIAEAAHRLPMVTGDLYAEDRHRLETAVAALERLFARWSTS